MKINNVDIDNLSYYELIDVQNEIDSAKARLEEKNKKNGPEFKKLQEEFELLKQKIATTEKTNKKIKIEFNIPVEMTINLDYYDLPYYMDSDMIAWQANFKLSKNNTLSKRQRVMINQSLREYDPCEDFIKSCLPIEKLKRLEALEKEGRDWYDRIYKQGFSYKDFENDN